MGETMGSEPLWCRFLAEEIENMGEVVLWYGVSGILERFEEWMKVNNYLDLEDERL